MKVFALLAAATVLAGCAADPRTIKPIPRDYQPLLADDCKTLLEREAATQKDLDRYVALQSNLRISDALGWLIPAWRVSDEDVHNEHVIARLSGELEAVQTARAIRCADSQPLSTPAT